MRMCTYGSQAARVARPGVGSLSPFLGDSRNHSMHGCVSGATSERAQITSWSLASQLHKTVLSAASLIPLGTSHIAPELNLSCSLPSAHLVRSNLE